MDYNSGTDERNAFRVDETCDPQPNQNQRGIPGLLRLPKRKKRTTREEMKIKVSSYSRNVGNDGMSGVVSSGAACTDVCLCSENIYELSFPCRRRRVTKTGTGREGGRK